MQDTMTSQEYMKIYRDKLSTKYQDLKGEKQLTETLQSGPEGDKTDVKNQMKAYVQELKSTREHKIQFARYHKDMQKVKRFFTMIFDDKRTYDLPRRMSSTFEGAKELFFTTDKEEWAQSQKVMKEFLQNVPQYQKDSVLRKIENRSKDPEVFSAEIQALIDSKPQMELGAKIKEVASRVVGEYDLLPLMGGCLVFGFLCNLSNIPPKDGKELFAVATGLFACALWLEAAIQGSITHTRKLNREQKQAWAEKNARQMLRRE